ncbi:MAG: tRNA threonylcarbamoyladenosine dehydratase [Myxococcota bacterium]|jgi:tRNA A37 threonylcarbamoyladenosine dehydratase|nr:tRNA threonylcarbamoyladenosine dehydratase [Myxococcota bacterium]
MPTLPIFHRAELLLGTSAMDRLSRSRAVVFGVGGVGSWSAEALVRTGLGHLTLVDSDLICITNANRQVQATACNAGAVKVTALAQRLSELAPACDIVPVQKVYSPATRDEFDLGGFDYVLDAIDSLSCKVDLIASAHRCGATVFASMGAASKLDPTQIRVASIWKTEICPLARRVRRGLREIGFDGDVPCVYSPEIMENSGVATACGSHACMCPRLPLEEGVPSHEWCSHKAFINGSLVHVTAAFGMALAGLVIQDIFRQSHRPSK